MAYFQEWCGSQLSKTIFPVAFRGASEETSEAHWALGVWWDVKKHILQFFHDLGDFFLDGEKYMFFWCRMQDFPGFFCQSAFPTKTRGLPVVWKLFFWSYIKWGDWFSQEEMDYIYTRWWFQKFFRFSPLPVEMIQFDKYFQMG